MAGTAQSVGVTSPLAAPPMPRAPSAPPPFWARIETLWLLFVPLCALLYALLLPLAPNDLWYHVRAGELLFQSGHIPTTNAMSSGVALDTPFYYQSWLAQAALYQTLDKFGLSGLQWLRAFCVGGAFALLLNAGLWWAKSEKVAFGSSARALAAGALWAFLLTSNNMDLRPQTFSFLLCAVWIALLIRFWRSPSLLCGAGLGAVALVWANTHGAFVLAPASLLLLSCAQTFAGRARPLWMATLLVVALPLLNPHGAHLYVYLAQLSNNVTGQKFIQEWRSPGFDEWHSLLFWASPICIAGLWRLSRAPKSWAPWLAPLALTWVMGVRDQRAMMWFALFGAPLVGLLLARLARSSSPTPVPRAAGFINAVLLAILLASPLAFAPSLKAQWPWPDAFVKRFAPTPHSVFVGQPDLLLERTTPVAAVEWWEKHPPKARTKVWTDMVPGSFMTWATRRQGVLPLCDPRIELFSDAFWEDYVRLSGGPRGAGDELLKRGFSQALVDQESQPGLTRELRRAGWQKVAGNGSTLLFLAPRSRDGNSSK